jgi:hypothetical protein
VVNFGVDQVALYPRISFEFLKNTISCWHCCFFSSEAPLPVVASNRSTGSEFSLVEGWKDPKRVGVKLKKGWLGFEHLR